MSAFGDEAEIFCLTRALPPSGVAQSVPRLFGDHSSCWSTRRLFRWRDHECDPGVPAIGPVLVREFPVAFDVEIALRRGAQGNNESELWTHANHPRLEAAHPIAGTAVATDLLVDIAHKSGQKLLGQE